MGYWDAEEVARLVWAYPGFSPAHAEDLKAKFDELMDMARKYPEQLKEIATERDKRAQHYLKLYDARFASDRKQLESEIKAQGGYDSVLFTMQFPGYTPKTVKEFANAIRMTCFDAKCQGRTCQADFRQAVLDYIELLVTLNDTVVRPHMGQTSRPDGAADFPEVENGPWADIPNEPITLDKFMIEFCKKRTRETRRYRRKALLAAARNGTVAMPPLATPHKNGQSNTYFAHDLLDSWQGFIDENVDLPPLLPQYRHD